MDSFQEESCAFRRRSGLNLIRQLTCMYVNWRQSPFGGCNACHVQYTLRTSVFSCQVVPDMSLSTFSYAALSTSQRFEDERIGGT